MPVCGAATSMLAPGMSSSATRSPSVTASPSPTSHWPKVIDVAPASGTRMGVASVTAWHHFARVITRPYVRPGDDGGETEQSSFGRDVVEFGRRHEPRHGNVLQRRGEILAEREHVAADGP